MTWVVSVPRRRLPGRMLRAGPAGRSAVRALAWLGALLGSSTGMTAPAKARSIKNGIANPQSSLPNHATSCCAGRVSTCIATMRRTMRAHWHWSCILGGWLYPQFMQWICWKRAAGMHLCIRSFCFVWVCRAACATLLMCACSSAAHRHRKYV